MTNGAESYIRDDELDVSLPQIDWQVLKNLREQGDYPDCPRVIDHFLYPEPSASSDQIALIRLIQAESGWDAVAATEGGIHATVTSPATAIHLAEQIETITRLGNQTGFAYDGWGTVTTKDCE